MKTLTVFLINVHAHFFKSILISNKQRKFEQAGFKNFKKINSFYLHCCTHFTKVILAKTL
jgi:hypothetical protein